MVIYKAVIVDDEINNISILNHFVSKYCLDIQVVGQALTVAAAITEINTKKPDLVFLDVRLNEEEAFEILDKIEPTDMQIIFVTAYDEYAMKAFRYNAIDYILKPISIEEVVLAVNKVIKKIKEQNYFNIQTVSNIYRENEDTGEGKDYMAVESAEKIDLIKTSEIMYIGTDGKHAIFYLKDGKQLLSNKNIDHYEKLLDEAYFFSIHHSHVINMRYVAKIIKKDGSYCELIDGTLLPIAKKKQEDFNRFLKIKE